MTVGERTVNLTPTEFDLLAVLMSAPGRVFSRAELLTELQGIAFEGIERTVDVHVRNLRRKIEPDPEPAALRGDRLWRGLSLPARSRA